MAPTKFLPGNLVLVDFRHDGYWPAEITKIFKNSMREVKCFGEGERGEALPKDMIQFNYASMKANLSDSSWKKDPARKNALDQITGKYLKPFQNNNDESNQKNEGGAKDMDTMVEDHKATNDKQNRAINEVGNLQLEREQLLKNLQDTKRNLDGETQKRIELENALEKIKSDNKKLELRCRSDKEIKEIWVQADYEEKLQRRSAAYKKKIADLEARVGDELSASVGAKLEIVEYKIKLENITAKVANLELHNKSLEKSIKNHTNDLEDLAIEHKEEISKKVEENKLLNDQIRQLQKDKEELVEEKFALEKECSTHGTSVEESRPGWSPSPDSSRQEPREVIRKRSMEVNESFVREAKYKRKRLDALVENSRGLELDESYSKEDKNKRKNLEEDDSLMGPEVDQSYSEEDKNKRKNLEEDDSSTGPEDQSYSEEDENKRKNLEEDDSSTGPEVDQSYSEEDKNKRKNLEEDDSSTGPEVDQSYSEENMMKGLEEHESSMEVEESHAGEAKNEAEESYYGTNCRIM